MDKDQCYMQTLWDLIASGSIYSWKKHIDKSYMMVIEVNNYIK